MGLDSVTNLTQIVEVFVAADGFGGGLLGLAILIIVGLGSLFLMANFNSKDALVSSSFVTMIVGIFLKYLDLVGDGVLLFVMVLFLVAIVFTRIKSPTPI